MARGDVDEREHRHLRFGGDLRRLDDRRVARELGALALGRREGRVVDEELGSVCRDPRLLAGTRVAGDDDLAPRAIGLHHLLRTHLTVAARDRFAPLQRPVGGSGLNAESLRGLGIEATRTRVLVERVPVGDDPVVGVEGLDHVSVPLHQLAPVELVQRDLVGGAAHDPGDRGEQVDEPGWAEDVERLGAVLHVVALQQPRQAQVVVGVQMGDEDRIDGDQPSRALHLPLRPLAAVEQDAIASAAHEDARGVAPRRGHRAPGAEEDDVQVHARKRMRGRGLLDCRPRRP